MLFPPVIHNFRYKARVEHGNEYKLSFLKSLGCKPRSNLISREMALKNNHKMKTFLIIITHAGKSKNVISAVINAVNI